MEKVFTTGCVNILVSIHIFIKRLLFIPHGVCRFTPTCSHYAVEALQVYGPVKALPRILWRLMRCHPFSRGGFDPVSANK